LGLLSALGFCWFIGSIRLFGWRISCFAAISNDENSVSNDESSDNSEDETSRDETNVDNGNDEDLATPFVEYGYKLFVNDEEIDIEGDKIFLYEDNVMVSFVTIMSALDAEFEWQSDIVAKMYWADMTFTLDVEKCKLTDDACEYDSDWIQGVSGGRSYLVYAKNDIFVDARALKSFFGMVGLEIRVYPYTERKVDIKTTPKYPTKLEYVYFGS
jgi:hypothetical protein